MTLKKNKIIFSILIISLFAFFVLFLPNIDAQGSWLLALAFTLFALILFTAIFDEKKAFLILLIAFPTIIKFHESKIQIGSIFHGLKFVNLPLNLTALTAGLIILFGILTLITQWHNLKKIPLKIILSLYLFYALVSFLWSENISASLIGIIYVFAPFSAYVFAYSYFKEKKDFVKLIFAVILSAIIPIGLSFYQLITGDLFFHTDSSLGRVNSTFVHPNLFGLYLSIIIGLAITFYFSKKEKAVNKNKLLLLFLFLALFCLAVTYSRVAWACLALFLILFSLIKKYLAVILALTFPIAVIFSFLIENIRTRITEVFSYSLFSSWTGRLDIWRVAMAELVKKPISGHGIGTSEMVVEEAKDWEGGTALSHNDFILYALELGLIGVLFFASYTLGAIYYLNKIIKKTTDSLVEIKIGKKIFNLDFKTMLFGILALFASTLLASLFESPSRGIVIQIMLWALLGSAFSFNKRILEK